MIGYVVCGVLLLVLSLITALRAGRAAALIWLDRIAMLALSVAIGWSARYRLGSPLNLVVLPPFAAAVWFGSTTLGMLNFLVLQWFGVRLVRVRFSDVPTRVRWTVLRWVWPLTGWWSEYRSIWKRPGNYCRDHDDCGAADAYAQEQGRGAR